MLMSKGSPLRILFGHAHVITRVTQLRMESITTKMWPPAFDPAASLVTRVTRPNTQTHGMWSATERKASWQRGFLPSDVISRGQHWKLESLAAAHPAAEVQCLDHLSVAFHTTSLSRRPSARFQNS